MKKTVIWMLSCLLALSFLVIPFFSFADESAATTPVYYPNGTVYLNESMISAMTADQLAEAFVAGFGAGTTTWNAETGKLEIATTTNTFMDIHAVDQALVLENYTIAADLCVQSTTFEGKVLMGMGINSASADGWNHGFYWQCNFQSTETGDVELYINNYDKDAKQQNGGGSKTKTIYSANGYKIGETVIHVEIKVGTEMVQVLYDGNPYFTFEKEKLTYDTGLPFFMIRGNTTLAVDNLLIYSGTGDVDPVKTISNTQPISEPESASGEQESSEDVTTEADVQTEESVVTTTAEDVTTETPDDETTAATEDETTAATEEKGGCQSVMGSGLILLIACIGIGGLAVRKKES